MGSSVIRKAHEQYHGEPAVPDAHETGQVQWVGADPESGGNECPAVAVMPETGDFLMRGKTVTDPAVITALNQHIGKADDESDIWLPARMASLIREALDGYEQARHGPGQRTVAELIAAAHESVIRFEVGGSGDDSSSSSETVALPADPGCTGGGDAVGAAVVRGVTVRRLQVLPVTPGRCEPDGHRHPRVTPAGEAVRWLPRARAAGLLLPGADCWLFDYRVVRWDFPDTDGTRTRCCAFSSEPRVIRDIAAVFEMAWSRAVPACPD
jgi:hypothetical protein